MIKEADKIKKIKNKVSHANTEKRREYGEVYLRRTFKVLLTDCINHIQKCPVRWAVKKISDIQLVEGFLSFPPVRQVVLNNQPLFREAVNRRLEQQEQTRQQQEQRAARDRDREERRQDQVIGDIGDDSEGGGVDDGGGGRELSTGGSDLEDFPLQSGGEESQAFTLPSDLEREDRLDAERRKKRKSQEKKEGIDAKVPIDLLKLLGPTFTQWSISHNAAVDIIAAVYNEIGIDLDEVIISYTTSKRSRVMENELMSTKAIEDLVVKVKEENIKLTLGYDTKLLEQRMVDGRVTKDRLALVLMGDKLEKPFLLCMPGLEGGTAREQAEEAYGALAKWDLLPFIVDLVYDTTATNTGRLGGTVRLLQLLINRALICSPCRRSVKL